ncbi:MAG: PAS domain-containing protein [Rhodospirillales bacterium]|nr:PAS domain-containing protein [Rhodospirillales bacterium]
MDVQVTGVELFFDKHEVIVSKTDLTGRITYANRVFERLSGYTEAELVGAPHNLIRHPDMPRCVFKLLWDVISGGRECFAYVVNRSRSGDHYWVFAHVTPSRDTAGRIIGYHSNRRVPDRRILDQKVIPLYRTLLTQERCHADRKQGMAASTATLTTLLTETGMKYNEWIFSL